jgi:polar amino acid transport system permease protein
MWFFFAFPIIAPFEVDAFTAAVLALSLNTSAFFAEIFRTGIQSIAPGQWDAARAIGMSYGQQLRRVVLPQAVRRMIPAFTNRWIELIKLTSLAATIAYTEILHTARLVASAYYNPVEMFTAAALIYFAIIYPMVRLTYWLETRMRRSGV